MRTKAGLALGLKIKKRLIRNPDGQAASRAQRWILKSKVGSRGDHRGGTRQLT